MTIQVDVRPVTLKNCPTHADHVPVVEDGSGWGRFGDAQPYASRHPKAPWWHRVTAAPGVVLGAAIGIAIAVATASAIPRPTIRYGLAIATAAAVAVLGWVSAEVVRFLNKDNVDLRRRTQEVLDAVDSVIWQTTAIESSPVVLNRAAMEHYGTTHSQVTTEQFLALVDPVDRSLLRRQWEHAMQSGGTHLIEARVNDRDGARIVVHRLSVTLGPDASQTRVCGVQIDVTDQRQAEHAVLYQATHDPLTSLPNRVMFIDRMEQALVRARRERQRCAVLVFDLTGFKDINDSLGYNAGDQLLSAIARRLESALRDADAVARIGGDEFGVVGQVADQQGARRLAERVREMLAAPFEVRSASGDDEALSIRSSIGIAIFPDNAIDGHELLRMADLAMYRSKKYGYAHHVYTSDLQTSPSGQLELLGELQGAIDRSELRLHYQPAISMTTGEVVWVEALVRWRHPRQGLVPPDSFLELIEVSGMIPMLTRWVTSNAIAQAAAWSRRGLDLNVHVNVATRMLREDPFDTWLGQVLSTHGIAAERLGIEFTERDLIAEPSAVQEAFERMKAIGVRTVLDDFGIGFSSLSYLRDLAVDAVKIDREFVQRLSSARDVTIVRSIIGLAHELGQQVVAEGVEDERTRSMLTSMGCDIAQGYLFSKPVPPEDLPAAVERLQSLANPARGG